MILTGPYGEAINEDLSDESNVLCIAGGTGICFVLPVLLDLARRKDGGKGIVELFWVVRSTQHAEWVRKELEELRESGVVNVNIHSTRSASVGTSFTTTSGDLSPSAEEKEGKDLPTGGAGFGGSGRPDLKSKVNEFVMASEGGAVTVFVSGPGGMTSDVRDGVAVCNSARDVWTGDKSGEVKMIYDERLE